jgi:peptide/nickel transport system ATP-binding protein
MTALLETRAVAKRFQAAPSLGERIAGLLGAKTDMRAAHAVDGVNLAVAKGEVLGLVGESGCGKTTLGRMIAGILPPSAGAALIDGAPAMSGGKRPVKTTTRVQMVFQDPFGSLDPRMRVGDIVSEGPVAHGIVSAQDARGDAERWLATVGLDASAPTRWSATSRSRRSTCRSRRRSSICS